VDAQTHLNLRPPPPPTPPVAPSRGPLPDARAPTGRAVPMETAAPLADCGRRLRRTAGRLSEAIMPWTPTLGAAIHGSSSMGGARATQGRNLVSTRPKPPDSFTGGDGRE
jgi:hypothetical protein